MGDEVRALLRRGRGEGILGHGPCLRRRDERWRTQTAAVAAVD